MMRFIGALFAAFLAAPFAQAEDMKMAVTTSFHNSGLSDILLPAIKEDLGLTVQLLVVGTGQALRLGKSGDVDAILVHSKSSELEFVAEGHAPHRTEIMYNDFVFVGPSSDPAKVKQATDTTTALRNIQKAKAKFVSRGDDSGTHKKERSLWTAAQVDAEQLNADWYTEIGAGMGAALNTTSALNAYTLTDRASWLKFGNKGELALVFEGDPVLFNQYAYLPIAADKHPRIKSDLAAKLEAWLISSRAKSLIDGYRLEGTPLFTFNAKMDET